MIRMHTAATIASLRDLEHELDVVARQSLGQGANFALRHAGATTKFKDKTGRLREGLHRVDRDALHIEVRSRAKHTIFVEEDTKAHVIKPRRKRILRFMQGGTVRFAGRVQHPGTTGTHFMRDARDAAEVLVTRFIELGLNRAIG